MSKGGRGGGRASNRSLRGHEEHAAGLGTKATKVSVVTAMCCFWEGCLLPQLSMVVSDNFGFSGVHSRNRALVYYRTIPPGFTLCLPEHSGSRVPEGASLPLISSPLLPQAMLSKNTVDSAHIGVPGRIGFKAGNRLVQPCLRGKVYGTFANWVSEERRCTTAHRKSQYCQTCQSHRGGTSAYSLLQPGPTDLSHTPLFCLGHLASSRGLALYVFSVLRDGKRQQKCRVTEEANKTSSDTQLTTHKSRTRPSRPLHWDMEGWKEGVGGHG